MLIIGTNEYYYGSTLMDCCDRDESAENDFTDIIVTEESAISVINTQDALRARTR